jgi:hypothetical protein
VRFWAWVPTVLSGFQRFAAIHQVVSVDSNWKDAAIVALPLFPSCPEESSADVVVC